LNKLSQHNILVLPTAFKMLSVRIKKLLWKLLQIHIWYGPKWYKWFYQSNSVSRQLKFIYYSIVVTSSKYNIAAVTGYWNDLF